MLVIGSLSCHSRAKVLPSLRPLLPRFLQCRSGVSSVEFALLLPVLTSILFGIISLGSAFFLLHNMEEASREAARRLALGELNMLPASVTCSDATVVTGTAEEVACGRLVSWGFDYAVEATRDCANSIVSIEVSVAGSDAALGDVFGILENTDLRSETTMRDETGCRALPPIPGP